MKRWFFIVSLLFFSSCVFQSKPVTQPYPWNFVKRPAEILKGVVKCSVYCSNGTNVSGKAVVKVDSNKALVKVYGPAGVYGGKIVMRNGEVFADENLSSFAKYLYSPKQLKSILTGYIYGKSYKIITPYTLRISFGRLKETYMYGAEGIKKVVISDGTCNLVIKPVKVIEEKK
ncbi:hypothetical protein [Desulfurobacterium indicum]|uniref:Lipoprotein n=1 Tax=Desulfurobacterium indicum TaxID=1914305 RepID=A0A1R1ML95_9BACT|nr:hypothetical protein [Desulfurobacterium indicum]OMH40585.1 hypothetical protein BLW93_04645 [Desulfurobacterium indicum]